jgi:spoIIIJ-associated protein
VSELRVEAEGETVGEAKWAALRELERRHPGVDKASVRFEVVAEGQRGLLGVGYAPARVVATANEPERAAPSPAPPELEVVAADPDDQPARAREIVQRIVAGLGVAADVSAEERDDEIHVTCAGNDLGVLIGRHGHTIDAIQYLVNAILARSGGDGRAAVVVDAAGYRARRSAALEALATRGAQRALALGETVALEPMTAVERKVVHLHLRDEPGIETASEGAEPNRYVVIRPVTPREPSTV